MGGGRNSSSVLSFMERRVIKIWQGSYDSTGYGCPWATAIDYHRVIDPVARLLSTTKIKIDVIKYQCVVMLKSRLTFQNIKT